MEFLLCTPAGFENDWPIPGMLNKQRQLKGKKFPKKQIRIIVNYFANFPNRAICLMWPKYNPGAKLVGKPYLSDSGEGKINCRVFKFSIHS